MVLLAACSMLSQPRALVDGLDTGVSAVDDAASTDSDGDGVADRIDCAPDDPSVHPGAIEFCNDIDDDCDGDIDEDAVDAAVEAWWDWDVDGIGAGEPVLICGWAHADPHLVPMGGDCDDTRSDIAPGYVDANCDGIDNDCSGEADDEAPIVTAWLDLDGDGYGSDGTTMPEVMVSGCDPWAVISTPDLWVERGGDCDDTDPLVNPLSWDPECPG